MTELPAASSIVHAIAAAIALVVIFPDDPARRDPAGGAVRPLNVRRNEGEQRVIRVVGGGR